MPALAQLPTGSAAADTHPRWLAEHQKLFTERDHPPGPLLSAAQRGAPDWIIDLDSERVR